MTNQSANGDSLEKVYEVFIDAFSGATGGVAACLLLYPLENFRTRLQASNKSEDQKQHTRDDNQRDEKVGSKSERLEIIKALRQMIKKDGFLSFYKGLPMALIATVASYGSYFFWYRFWKNVFTQIFKVETLFSRHIMLITAVAGATSSACANPCWFINTRMTLEKDSSKSIMQTVKEIYENEGIRAFFKGVLPNMILVLNPIINFVIYEALKKWMLDRKKHVGSLQIFLLSSIGKTMATFATYPILTVRVRMHASKDTKMSIPEFLIHLLKTTGISDLYRGMPAKLVQTVLYNAFLLLTYEKLRAAIKFLMFRNIKGNQITISK